MSIDVEHELAVAKMLLEELVTSPDGTRHAALADCDECCASCRAVEFLRGSKIQINGTKALESMVRVMPENICVLALGAISGRLAGVAGDDVAVRVLHEFIDTIKSEDGESN